MTDVVVDSWLLATWPAFSPTARDPISFDVEAVSLTTMPFRCLTAVIVMASWSMASLLMAYFIEKI